jgi:hypothetical protein
MNLNRDMRNFCFKNCGVAVEISMIMERKRLRHSYLILHQDATKQTVLSCSVE